MTTEPIENTTLALQHYYDVKGIIRKTKLSTVYSATEQPFGRTVDVWVLHQLEEMHPPAYVRERLENFFLQARKITHSACARVLDFGNISNHEMFVILDSVSGPSLTDWLGSHGAMTRWQAYRVVEQLASLTAQAHSLGLQYLVLAPENIYVVDEKRFEIRVAPIGLGLYRTELLEMEDALVSVDLVKHIPPWEFAKQRSAISPTKHDTVRGEVEESESSSEDRNSDSIQDLDSEVILEKPSVTTIPSTDGNDMYCPDLYAIACMAYTCLSGSHPYFREGRDVSDAVLTMLQESPIPLSESVQLEDGLSQLISKYIQEPLKGPEAIEKFTRTFRNFLSKDEIDAVEKASAFYQTPNNQDDMGIKHHRMNVQRFGKSVWITGAVAILVLAVLMTWSLASIRRPVELFNLPELIPQDLQNEGVNIIVLVDFESKGRPDVEAEVYMSSLDGELIYLGTAPYVLKNQQVGARLSFVISADGYKSAQSSLVVRESDHRTQVVTVTLSAQK